ncbi:MAG: putative lipid II flippase FtsW [Elusimicrobiota bacterium]
MKKPVSFPDIVVIIVVAILVIAGLLMVYSASAIIAEQRYGSTIVFLKKQLLWVLLGASAAFILQYFDYNYLQKLIWPILFIVFVLLVLVLFAPPVAGVHRWLRWGPIGLQPSELAKLALIIYVAGALDRKQSKIQKLKGLTPLLLIVGTICGLILVEPDLGTPFLIGMIVLGLFFAGGVRVKHIFYLTMPFVAAVFISLLTVSYRWKRMIAFLDPWADPQGTGYQIVQSLLALGNGGWIGRGFGGSRSKLLYLPEPHTDFIFPILGEEWGLLGSFLIMFLFGVLFWRGLKIAAQAPNLFGSLLATGITIYISFQALLNISVSCGLLPTKGIPLPFLSFGGSSILFTLAAVGILLNISRQSKV